MDSSTSDSTETSCVGFGIALESGLAGRAGIQILKPVQEDVAAWREETALKFKVLFLALTMYFILYKVNGLSIQTPMIMHKMGHNGMHFVLCTHGSF